ncbi:2118_t:CDS:2, partial [Cetraspora pellucida]
DYMNESKQAQGWYNCNGGCLEGYLRPIPFSEVKSYCLDDGRATIIKSQEIKTPEFIRYAEEEARIQQEQLRKHQQEFKSKFNCEKCSKPIALGEEKEHCFIKHFENSSVGVVGHIDPEKTNIKTSPTFERYREYKKRLKKTYPTPAYFTKWENQKLLTAQEYRQQQQEREEQKEE